MKLWSVYFPYLFFKHFYLKEIIEHCGIDPTLIGINLNYCRGGGSYSKWVGTLVVIGRS